MAFTLALVSRWALAAVDENRSENGTRIPAASASSLTK